MLYNLIMILNTHREKIAFQKAFLKKAGVNFAAVKAMMDELHTVGFYIKDAEDRIVALNRRNCELSALRDEFDAIGRKSSDLFPNEIGRECLKRDAIVRKTQKPTIGGVNYKTVDRDPTPTVYCVFPLFDGRGRLIGTMCGFHPAESYRSQLSPRQQLMPALKVLAEETSRTHSLAELAALTGLSVSHFRRLFRDVIGESPAKYALRLRLNRARDELEKSNQTIADIAADNGFYDQSHFVKAFHSVYKLSPGAYRQRHAAHSK